MLLGPPDHGPPDLRLINNTGPNVPGEAVLEGIVVREPGHHAHREGHKASSRAHTGLPVGLAIVETIFILDKGQQGHVTSCADSTGLDCQKSASPTEMTCREGVSTSSGLPVHTMQHWRVFSKGQEATLETSSLGMNRDIPLEHKGTHGTALSDRLYCKRTSTRQFHIVECAEDKSRDRKWLSGWWGQRRGAERSQTGRWKVLEVACAGNTMSQSHAGNVASVFLHDNKQQQRRPTPSSEDSNRSTYVQGSVVLGDHTVGSVPTDIREDQEMDVIFFWF